jgi:hypothetical protein
LMIQMKAEHKGPPARFPLLQDGVGPHGAMMQCVCACYASST